MIPVVGSFTAKYRRGRDNVYRYALDNEILLDHVDQSLGVAVFCRRTRVQALGFRVRCAAELIDTVCDRFQVLASIVCVFHKFSCHASAIDACARNRMHCVAEYAYDFRG